MDAIPHTLAKVPQLLESRTPTALLLDMGPEGLEIEAAVWIDDPARGKATVQSAMNLALLNLLKEQQVRLASSLPS